MNKVIITGNLTHDVEQRNATNGKTVTSFTVAVNIKRGGEQVANFYRVDAWGALGDVCAKYLKKGQKCLVSGSLFLREFDKKDGSKGYSLDVLADSVEFLSPPSENAKGANDKSNTSNRAPAPQPNEEEDDEDIL